MVGGSHLVEIKKGNVAKSIARKIDESQETLEAKRCTQIFSVQIENSIIYFFIFIY